MVRPFIVLHSTLKARVIIKTTTYIKDKIFYIMILIEIGRYLLNRIPVCFLY